MSGLNFEELNELFRQTNRSHPQRFTILIGLKNKIMWDTIFVLRETKLRFFWTDTRRAYDYAEITPYNKGSLWKIRCFVQGHYHVYYGTVKKAYCTTIQDVINFINIKS